MRVRRRLAAAGSMGRPARMRTRSPIRLVLRRTKRSWRRNSCFASVTLPVPPPPSRCGRLRYKPCRIMRIWTVPSIKYVFLKDLSLNLSSDWSYGRVLPPPSIGDKGKSHRCGGFCLLQSVTGTVSIFRVANWRVGNGRNLRCFPRWALPSHYPLAQLVEASSVRIKDVPFLSVTKE
jgi:hypothetical protein